MRKHVFRFPVTMEGFWKIQLFRGRLSEKVNATIPKGIVGGFDFTVLQRNLKNGTRGHGLMYESAKGKQQN